MGEGKFDPWAADYAQWYKTPRGAMVLDLERAVILGLAQTQAGERALDEGCAPGKFT